jgi:hypothetical protein
MNAKQICGVIVALCVAAVAARADSLELKNGTLINGKFTGAGANVFVAGASVFGNSKGITVAMVDLRDSVAETTRA